MADSDLVKLILLLGSIAGALAGISALIVKVTKGIRKVIDYFKTLGENVKTLL